MCIAYSVGRGGRNELANDGRVGPNTFGAIEAFETRVMKLPYSDGIIAPGDSTLKALLAGLPPGATKEKLAIVLPQALPSRIELFFQPLVTGMEKYGITTPLQIAHFIAQIGLESGNLLYTEEIADGSRYEGRVDLGNTHSGDGKRFKGRGLIQLTGRNNYTQYSKYTGKDFLTDPTPLATDPYFAVDAACWFWTDRKLGPWADADNVREVTRRINGLADGPYTHLDLRIANLNRAKALLGL